MAQHMTDEELDRNWKPSGRRPQSTIARTFSQELMDIFRIENSVADLDEKLDQRQVKSNNPNTPIKTEKHNVQSQTTELEALEKRIKEMEDRLKRNSTSNHARQPLSSMHQAAGPASTPASADSFVADKARSRPGTARQNQPSAPSSANMPPTPTASEGDYDFVGKHDLDDAPPTTSRH